MKVSMESFITKEPPLAIIIVGDGWEIARASFLIMDTISTLSNALHSFILIYPILIFFINP